MSRTHLGLGRSMTSSFPNAQRNCDVDLPAIEQLEVVRAPYGPHLPHYASG